MRVKEGEKESRKERGGGGRGRGRRGKEWRDGEEGAGKGEGRRRGKGGRMSGRRGERDALVAGNGAEERQNVKPGKQSNQVVNCMSSACAS